MGIDHVGVSSDSRVDGWAVDDIHHADAVLASPDRWRVVARRLRSDFGYSDAMLQKLLGLNFKRVYEQLLPGVHPPRLTRAGRLALVFERSVHRGVPEPTYDVELQIREPGQFVALRSFDRTTSTEIDPGDLQPARYRWRATAVAGDLRAASAWQEFTVDK